MTVLLQAFNLIPACMQILSLMLSDMSIFSCIPNIIVETLGIIIIIQVCQVVF